MKPVKFSLKSRISSLKFAFNGLLYLFKHEHNARIHAIAAILATLCGIFLKISLYEWISLTIVMGFVFMTELFNSSLETLSDITEPGFNEKIRTTKDFAAAAVLVAAFTAIIVGALIFLPKMIMLL